MYQGGLAQSHKDNRLDLNHGNIAASLLIRGGTIAQDDVELVASWLKFAESFMRAAAKPSVEPGAAPVGAADENEQI